MVVLLHKWKFKNTEVEFLKVSEKNWSSDIEARKSWIFLILTVQTLCLYKMPNLRLSTTLMKLIHFLLNISLS